MVIRPATWLDSLQLTVMWAKMHLEINKRQDLIVENSNTKAMFHRIIERLNDPNWVILVAQEDEIAGFIMTHIHYPLYNQCHIVGSVECLYVYPQFRGKGVYRELIQEMEKIGQERKVSVVEINCLNEKRILDFYDHLGYEPVQVILRQKEQI